MSNDNEPGATLLELDQHAIGVVKHLLKVTSGPEPALTVLGVAAARVIILANTDEVHDRDGRMAMNKVIRECLREMRKQMKQSTRPN